MIQLIHSFKQNYKVVVSFEADNIIYAINQVILIIQINILKVK